MSREIMFYAQIVSSNKIGITNLMIMNLLKIEYAENVQTYE